MDPQHVATSQASRELEAQIAAVGARLGRTVGDILQGLPGGPHGPAELARTIGVDKVLASRVVKAAYNKDPMAVIHLIPGPEPLRRLVRSAGRRKIAPEQIAAAEEAIESFETLIRREAGDRSALDAIISAWLPEARAEFELRRKQSAFRAVSQLKGAAADVSFGTAILHPAADGAHIDIVWLFGLLGLRRLRPGSTVKFATRRLANGDNPRRPMTLDGVPVEGLDGLRLDEFSSVPSAPLNVHQVGDVVQYTLADVGFGPSSATDLVFAEVNLGELPGLPPVGAVRKSRYVFAEVTVPAKVLIFDALVDDRIATADPNLYLYDTSFDGVADPNNPARDIDRLDLRETVTPLGRGITKFRTTEVPRYLDLLRHTCDKLAWDGTRFRAYRCRIDYPLYGSQVVMTFDAAPAASPA